MHWYRVEAGSYRAEPTAEGSRFYAMENWSRLKGGDYWVYGTRVTGRLVPLGDRNTLRECKAACEGIAHLSDAQLAGLAPYSDPLRRGIVLDAAGTRFYLRRDGSDRGFFQVISEDPVAAFARVIQRCDAPGMTVENVMAEIETFRHSRSGLVSRLEWRPLGAPIWVAEAEDWKEEAARNTRNREVLRRTGGGTGWQLAG